MSSNYNLLFRFQGSLIDTVSLLKIQLDKYNCLSIEFSLVLLFNFKSTKE